MMSKKELALVFEQLEKEQSFSGTILVSQDGEVLFKTRVLDTQPSSGS